MPEIGLSYLHYSGHVTAAEMRSSLKACTDHADFRSDFRHIADLSGITSYDTDYLAIMKVQAQVVGMLQGDTNPSCCVFLTPTPVSQSLAAIVARSWAAAKDPVIVILSEAEQVEMMLGLRATTIGQMRAAAKPLAMAGNTAA